MRWRNSTRLCNKRQNKMTGSMCQMHLITVLKIEEKFIRDLNLKYRSKDFDVLVVLSGINRKVQAINNSLFYTIIHVS